MKQVDLWTDGSCIGGKYGGVGALLLFNGVRKEFSLGYKDTTNNKMELMAVIQGLKLLKEPCQVKVFSDSQYVVKGATQWVHGWKRNNWMTTGKEPVKNKDYWQELDKLNSQHVVTYQWVKAHVGIPENEVVDDLARNAAEELRDECISKKG